MIKSQKGITLVALIITIIVMLILAGVSISLVLDEGGVLNKAQRTEEQQVEGTLREAIALANADLMAEFYANTAGYDKSNAEQAIKDAIQQNCSYKDEDIEVSVTLPTGDNTMGSGSVTAKGVYRSYANGPEVMVNFSINMSRRYPVIEATTTNNTVAY